MQLNARVYVSGNAKQMPTDVSNAVEKVILIEGICSSIEQSKKYVREMKRKQLFQVEAWN